MQPDDDPAAPRIARPSAWMPRAALGGALMGLANLVPGISGGTMLLAAGIYTGFIEALAAVSRLRLDRRSVELLLVVGASGACGILLFAGPIKDLVVGHRWIMYSLFVGLTLGGIPALWRMARPPGPALWVGAAAGVAAMAWLGQVQRAGAAAGAAEPAFAALVLAGAAGASSMILPGVSGGYVLLVLGQYVTILGAVEDTLAAMRTADLQALAPPVTGVLLPVALGLALGVAGVSNLVRWLLRSHRSATLGVLLGLLAGAVVGLWPFQAGIPPMPGSVLEGRVVNEDNVDTFDPEDWPVATFTPGGGQVVGSLLLVAAGYAATALVSRLGRDRAD